MQSWNTNCEALSLKGSGLKFIKAQKYSKVQLKETEELKSREEALRGLLFSNLLNCISFPMYLLQNVSGSNMHLCVTVFIT